MPHADSNHARPVLERFCVIFCVVIFLVGNGLGLLVPEDRGAPEALGHEAVELAYVLRERGVDGVLRRHRGTVKKNGARAVSIISRLASCRFTESRFLRQAACR